MFEVIKNDKQEELKELRKNDYTKYEEKMNIYISQLKRKTQFLKYWKFLEQVLDDVIKNEKDIFNQIISKKTDEKIDQLETILKKEMEKENDKPHKKNVNLSF